MHGCLHKRHKRFLKRLLFISTHGLFRCFECPLVFLPDGWSQTLAAGPRTRTSLSAALHSQDWKDQTHTHQSQKQHSLVFAWIKQTAHCTLTFLLCGMPLFSDEERLSQRGTDFQCFWSAEPRCVSVIDRTFQGSVSDMQCKMRKTNPFLAGDELKKSSRQ